MGSCSAGWNHRRIVTPSAVPVGGAAVWHGTCACDPPQSVSRPPVSDRYWAQLSALYCRWQRSARLWKSTRVVP